MNGTMTMVVAWCHSPAGKCLFNTRLLLFLEHDTTRTAAGLFDIDHMAQIEVRGPDAEAFVNYMVTYNVAQMKLYDAHYAIMCYEDGTCVDDVLCL